eukprot:641559-Prymnesium_polylepis.1
MHADLKGTQARNTQVGAEMSQAFVDTHQARLRVDELQKELAAALQATANVKVQHALELESTRDKI